MGMISKAEHLRRMELYDQGLKQCSMCSRELPIEQFRPNTRGWMGLRSRCSDCDNAASSGFRRRTPEYQRQRQKRWREANLDRSHAIGKAYRDAHGLKERLRAGRYRARKAGVPVEEITPEELLADWDRRGIDPDKCVYTGEPLISSWALDHAYPLSQPGSPGHVVSNLVPTNRSLNSSKGRRHWVEYLADRAEANV